MAAPTLVRGQMVDRDVRYCTAEDGVRIAYCVQGDGPALVSCPDFVGSFSLDHLIEDQMGFWRALWRGRRVVRYDMRGTGLSQREVDDVSHTALLSDLEAVVRAAGVREFTLWGGTISGPRTIEFAAKHRRLVRRLVLHRTFARARDIMSEDQMRSFAELARSNWPTAAQVFADLPVRRELPDAGVNQARVYTESTSGELVARLLIQGFETTDVTPLLPQVRVPTLVMHRSEDPMIPFRLGQGVAGAIPHARLHPLSQGIMSYLADGRINVVTDVINDFIDDGAERVARGQRAGPRSVQTVLFTDLVGHTELMQRLGDAPGRRVLREYERITREMLALFGGAELKTMGDGFMASFVSVSDAMDCAIALQRAFADFNASVPEPLQVRVGLNAGEPIEEGGDLFGASVIMASRVAAQAAGGEIMVPEPVRHLLSGKGYVYADRGEFLPKGFEDAVRLFEVRWRG